MRRIPRSWLLAVVGTVIIALFALQIPTAQPWTRVYDADLTWPHASKAVVSYLSRRFAGPLSVNDRWLKEGMSDHERSSWLIVTSTFQPDSGSLAQLCRTIRNGATVCIVGRTVGPILDSLNYGYMMQLPGDLNAIVNDTSNHLPGTEEVVDGYYLDELDTIVWNPILKSGRYTAAAERSFGKGRVILATVPQAFTNHALLYGGHDEVINAIIARMPDGPLTWDEHYKPRSADQTPLLSVLTQYPGLLFAYWVLLIGGLGAVVVNLKRRQRPIPVIPAMRDSAIEFVDQIAMMFWNRRDHRAVARQLLRQFRLHLVRRYRLQSQQISLAEAEMITRSTGCEPEVMMRLLSWHENIDAVKTMRESDLEQLHTDLEHFFSLSPP